MYKTNTSSLDGYVLTTFAQQLGWDVFQAPKLSEYGVPYIKHMYMDVFKRIPNCIYYTYSNGDILYSHGFIDTLYAVSQVHVCFRL